MLKKIQAGYIRQTCLESLHTHQINRMTFIFVLSTAHVSGNEGADQLTVSAIIEGQVINELTSSML